jgi:hypothetical protein
VGFTGRAAVFVVEAHLPAYDRHLQGLGRLPKPLHRFYELPIDVGPLGAPHVDGVNRYEGHAASHRHVSIRLDESVGGPQSGVEVGIAGIGVALHHKPQLAVLIELKHRRVPLARLDRSPDAHVKVEMHVYPLLRRHTGRREDGVDGLI